MHRRSLCAGSILWKVLPWRLVKCGVYKQLVFIYRWSLQHYCINNMDVKPSRRFSSHSSETSAITLWCDILYGYLK